MYMYMYMSNMISHPYHLVDESPWPLMASLSGLGLTFGLVKWFHSQDLLLTMISLFTLLMVMYQWWRDVSREGSYQGLHTSVVELGLRWGMVLFITSEVFFFLSFFWAFFHCSLSVNIELGSMWPPMGIMTFNPFGVPLLNTLILLSSGVSVTWAHHAIMEGKFNELKISLLTTVLLGLYFTALQAMEYYEATFNISDSVYGSTFFIATGFHGLHVIVGTTFLSVCLVRVMNGSFSSKHHFGFEAAAWYWHFVDVVWLFLYMCIYWWGGL
uniref:cytochrome c oxidase subunit 3 n=1 Tax=Ergasilus anchoratus TaxID=342414 RepID=UPI002E78602F|nr:cytochrome c oxidase subunit 3 [Ergasilus anchoratus]UUB71180.1 cytochrome c oxidase subunit 3 [Ergasilus anchoratus]